MRLAIWPSLPIGAEGGLCDFADASIPATAPGIDVFRLALNLSQRSRQGLGLFAGLPKLPLSFTTARR